MQFRNIGIAAIMSAATAATAVNAQEIPEGIIDADISVEKAIKFTEQCINSIKKIHEGPVFNQFRLSGNGVADVVIDGDYLSRDYYGALSDCFQALANGGTVNDEYVPPEHAEIIVPPGLNEAFPLTNTDEGNCYNAIVDLYKQTASVQGNLTLSVDGESLIIDPSDGYLDEFEQCTDALTHKPNAAIIIEGMPEFLR